jgi:hypothetical protein
MRIFQVCADPGIPFDGTKGASVHLRALADALQRRGHEVHVFAENPRVSRRVGRGIDVRTLEPGSLEDAASRLGRPDFVYERYALGHESGLQFARRVRSPFVLEVNAPLVLEASRHRPHKLRASDGELERRLFRQADVAATVSEPLRRYVAGIRGTDRGAGPRRQTSIDWGRPAGGKSRTARPKLGSVRPRRDDRPSVVGGRSTAAPRGNGRRGAVPAGSFLLLLSPEGHGVHGRRTPCGYHRPGRPAGDPGRRWSPGRAGRSARHNGRRRAFAPERAVAPGTGNSGPRASPVLFHLE